jgi:hypothetical protein
MRRLSGSVLIFGALILLHAHGLTGQSLDFQTYRTQVEPIFLKVRDGNGPQGSCFGCHTHVHTRFHLKPLPASLSWTEEQSRRNFEAVRRLVVPGDPAKSRLLLHPLAVDAGGDPVHSGGKHWQSQNDPEWQTIAAWIRAAAPSTVPAAPALDYETFKTRVQAIFLDKRDGFARCYVCHSQGTPFRLQSLDSGSTTWTEEQSRRNFEAVQRLIVPGDPTSSRLLMMPLAAEAGGDPFHPGGKRWQSQNDAEWRMLASWVRGERQ